MNFENCEAFVIPFRVQKTSAWKRVIHYLCEKETTPVEAICNSHVVSIDKEYYPVGQLEISYTARWNAVSIFKEHWTEQETHYEPEVHYFDRFGNEHKHAGFDYFDAKSRKWKSGTLNPIASRVKGYSGDANTRPWTPREVTVAVTENIPYERETGRQRTDGEISGKYIHKHSSGYPIYNIDFFEPEKVPYSEEILKDGTIIETSKHFSESDRNSAFSETKEEAKKQCVQQIPGQAYADFHMEFDTDEVFQTWYYPVYHIIYTFMEQQYECFVSGYQGESPINGKHNPEDASIESIKQQYDARISNLKDKKKKCWLKFVWIWLGICAVETFILPFFAIFLINNGILGTIITSVLPIVFIGVAIYLCWTDYKELKRTKREIKRNEESKKNIVLIRQAKKQEIMDIVLNDNLSDSEKAMRCEAILKQV